MFLNKMFMCAVISLDVCNEILAFSGSSTSVFKTIKLLDTD